MNLKTVVNTWGLLYDDKRKEIQNRRMDSSEKGLMASDDKYLGLTCSTATQYEAFKLFGRSCDFYEYPS